MSFLKNNWHWMLFSLVIFGGIGVVLFTQLHTDTEPKKVYNPPSEEMLQNIREKSAAQKAQEVDSPKRPPPAGETHETGYWHGDHWHRTAGGTSDTLQAGMINKDIGAMEAEYWASKGVSPPPPGYTYGRINGGELKLYPMNTPIIEVTWTRAYGDLHQISSEEFERYKALIAISSQTRLVIEGDDLDAYAAGTLDTTDKEKFPDDVAALAHEWAQELYKRTLGPLPVVNVYGSWNRPRTPEDDALKKRLTEEALAPHRRIPREPKSVDHELIESILIELKASL